MLEQGTKGMKWDLPSVNHCYCDTRSEAEGECSQGVNSQDGVHMQVTGHRLKNKNILLYKMQAPSAALSYPLLLANPLAFGNGYVERLNMVK